jgi:taurine dioxygenase
MGEGRIGRLAWRGLEPFGAEVAHDFREPLTPQEQAGFRDLLHQHQLLVMRGQSLSLAQQQAVAGYLGPVLTGGRGMEYVSPDDGILNETGMTFHSDLAFAPEPFAALSLHAVDVAEGRTSTRFASGVRAYQTLPDALKARLAGLRAVAMSTSLGAVRVVPFDVPANSIHQVRDVVMTHPVTGQPCLYVSESHAAHVQGLARADSDALLRELFGYLYAPGNRLEHVWANGDFLLWDNLALQHGRPDVTGIWPRKLQRAAVAERSLVEQLPDYFAKAAVGTA